MVIDIDVAAVPAVVQLVEPDDFAAFKIVARGAAAESGALASAIERIGRMTAAGEVFVDVEALRSLAGDRARDAGWLGALERMLSYAREKGWTDGAGAVQAHIQWTA